MSPIDIFIISLYYHFFQMQKRGRKVIPWFQTSFVIAMVVTMTLFSAYRLFDENAFKNVNEWLFISLFMAVGLGLFFLLKIFYFERGRHITLTEKYLNEYSDNKRALFKGLSIGICILLPLMTCFFIWYSAK